MFDPYEKNNFENITIKKKRNKLADNFAKRKVYGQNKLDYQKSLDKYNYNFSSNTVGFLCDVAEFTQASFATTEVFRRPLLNAGKWSKRIANIGETKVGNIFLKKAQDVTRVLPNNKGVKRTFGIADSGRTIRKTPLALAGVGAAGYGGYRAKKTYDKYQPEIKTARKAMNIYNNFKTKFNIGEDK